jgi:hypothetical protein
MVSATAVITQESLARNRVFLPEEEVLQTHKVLGRGRAVRVLEEAADGRTESLDEGSQRL